MNSLNRLIMVAATVALATAAPARAGEPREAGADDRRPPPPREESSGRSETLTAEQAAQVKAILAKYDAATLTAETAKAIHEAFRQAGLRGGPAMNDTIKAAGFDPEKLRDLAPPPGQGGRGDDRRPPEG